MTDQAAGAGVQEFLGLADPRYGGGGIVQAVTDFTVGDAITLHGGSSFTPPLVGAVAGGMVVLAWRPPPDKILIVDDAQFLSEIADESFCRIGKRHFLYGRNNVAAPRRSGRADGRRRAAPSSAWTSVRTRTRSRR